MSNWDPFDPVRKRVLYIESVTQGQEKVIRFLPFYQVTYPGLHGKCFEPVDALTRKQLGADINNSSEGGLKVINEIREIDRASILFNCEQYPDTQLHSFSFDWPR